jgi:glycosyltransferase involved in cell wall biosynthesis
MRIGVANEETWGFFNEVFKYLVQYHDLRLFKRRQINSPIFSSRINHYLYQHDLESLMRWSDVMFFEWASHLLVTASQLPKTCGIVTRLHRYELYQWVEQVSWDPVDKIIVVSEAKRDEFVKMYPDHASKVIVIPVSISLDRFQLQAKEFNGNIGILCHLTPRKRVYDLLLTFYELNKDNNGFHLHIAGGQHPNHGDYFYALKNMVERLGLQNKVTFYGNVTDTWNWYQKIDIFISNSYSEGLQVAPMEAMACGCYCFAHHWSGADELLPGENLYYSGQELNQKIIAYSALPEAKRFEHRNRMREIARSHFDIEKTKIRIREVIESAAI